MSAAKVVDGVLSIDPKICNNCGRCVGKCNFDAIENGTQGYKIYIGGRWGKKVAQGKALNKVFTSKEEALDMIEKVILLYREKGKTGERFAQMVERYGFNDIEKELLSNDILNRKQEILDAKLHLTGGATCYQCMARMPTSILFVRRTKTRTATETSAVKPPGATLR